MTLRDLTDEDLAADIASLEWALAQYRREVDRREAPDRRPCTCPSGDGSLRWPCPTHPPTTDPVNGGQE